ALGAGLVSLEATATIEDADGDTHTDSASLDIGAAIAFTDVGPNVDVTIVEGAEIPSLSSLDVAPGTEPPGDASADFSVVFEATSDYGADGEGSVSWEYSLAFVDGLEGDPPYASGLYSNGEEVMLTLDDGKIVG